MKRKILIALLTISIFSNLSGCAIKSSLKEKIRSKLNEINFIKNDKEDIKNNKEKNDNDSKNLDLFNNDGPKIKEKDSKTFSNSEYTFDYPNSYTEKEDEVYDLLLVDEKENVLVGVESTELNGRTDDDYFEWYFEALKTNINPDTWSKDKKDINGYNVWHLSYTRTTKNGDELEKVFVTQSMFFLNQKVYLFSCITDSEDQNVFDKFDNIINSVSFHI